MAVLRGEPFAPKPQPDQSGSESVQPTTIEGSPTITNKVLIGQGSFWLTPLAATAFKRAETIYGGQIKVVSAGRTRAEQVALRQANGCPDIYNAPSSSCRIPTARPGESQHEFGNAVDIAASVRDNPSVVSAMSSAGWCRYSPGKEPWHWSYGVCK